MVTNSSRLMGTRADEKDSMLESLTAFLCQHREVREALALCRPDLQGQGLTVAYIVPADMRSAGTLPARLESELAAGATADAFVLLNALPRTEDGEVDRVELERFQVLDEEFLQRCRRQISVTMSAGQTEVFAAEQLNPVSWVHRLDLVPGEVSAQSGLAPGAASGVDAREESSLSTGPAAIADGGVLNHAKGDPETLSDALRRAADAHAENGITHISRDGTEITQSYASLLEDAEQLLAGLAAIGFQPGDKVIFQLQESHEFLTAFWACVMGGMVPALVSVPTSFDSTSAAAQVLSNSWELLGRPAVLASDSVIEDVRSCLAGNGGEAGCVHSPGELPAGDRVPAHDALPDDPTLILFTSGSSGIPKGVVQSHRALLSMANGTIQPRGFNSQDVTLNWMPMEHVGAISFLHIMPVVLGCRQVHVPTEYILHDPIRWLDLLDRDRVSISWGPNFAFKLINERSGEVQAGSWDFSSMKFLVSAGEQIVGNTTCRFLDLMAPHKLVATALRPAFGMSETCSGITWSSGYDKQAYDKDRPFVDLGSPIPSASLRIVDDRQQVLREGEIGRLQVKGPSVTTGYFNNPEANSSVFTEDGWFDTGDVGFLLDGRLTLTGREKDEIVINGRNQVAAEIEAVVDTIDSVEASYSAACAVRRPGNDADELAIFFCVTPGDEARSPDILRTIRDKITIEFGVRPSYYIMLEKEQIPKTSIGKIQRRKLKLAFERGEYESGVKQADAMLGANLVPEWFHRKAWHATQITCRRPLGEKDPVLVFADTSGLGEILCARLRQSGVTCILAETAAGFDQRDDARYVMDPASSDDYVSLLQDVLEKYGPVARIIHCFSYAPGTSVVESPEAWQAEQFLGVYSLLNLVQALDRVQGDVREVQLHMVGCGTQMTSANDTAGCVHAASIGLIKTIPLELAWLRCCHVDLDTVPLDVAANRVLDELQSLDGDEEVAYREGRRLTWSLEKVALNEAEWTGDPIERNGIYLVTGGLGGIGAFLAVKLMRDHGIKAIILGRSELPPRDEWQERLSRGDKLGERLQHYLEIESLGGEFVYAQGDVADAERIREIIAEAEMRWDGRLAGIFHLAMGGNLDSQWDDLNRHSVVNESVDSFERIFRAKIHGTRTLYQIARERAGIPVVSFGSVIGVFGAAHYGSYGAAHTFMENFTRRQRYREGLRGHYLAWSVWEDIGLSRSDPAFARELYRAMGYSLIPKETGADCLMAAMGRGQPELVIGLDAANPNIRRYTDATPLQSPVAFVTSRDSATPDDTTQQLTVSDRFGVESQCEVHWVTNLPRTPEGEIDRDALLSQRSGEGVSKDDAPGSEIEKQIAAIWRDVLKVDKVGVQDSFFALGGNSLSATQATSRLRTAFNVQMVVTDLFEQGTVRGLAQLVASRQEDTRVAFDHGASELTDAETLLTNLDEMSDEQVAELLGRIRQQEAGNQ